LSTAPETPTQKLLHEGELFDAMSKKVIDRSIQVTVDNTPSDSYPGTWPGEILVKATRRLCKELGAEELTPFKIDRTLEDIVLEDSWGSFYWDSENKRHLRLNPAGWADKDKKSGNSVSSPPPTGFTVGPLV
jgi:hypothetical protein